MYKFGVLTVSDSCARGAAEDTSGPNLKRLLCDCTTLGAKQDEVITACVPDGIEPIQSILRRWCDELMLSLVLTTGGTGFSPRDLTPEATRPLLDREAPGLMVAMLTKSLVITPMAMLSRPVCGIRKNTIIVNLPGSRKGSQECLEMILPALPHALDLLSSRAEQVSAVHTQMAGVPPHTCPHGLTKETAGVPLRTRRVKEDFYNVASRPRHSPYPLLPVEEAVAIISKHTPILPEEESNTLLDALGQIVARDVHATFPLPPFQASVKDGYAVIASDGPGLRTITAPVVAGEMSTVAVVPGTAMRITTGAPLPPGADAVVQVEDTELVEKTDDGCEEKVIRILSPVRCGQDIRPVGFDIAEGQLVLSKGDRLGPSELGLLAAAGYTKAQVFRSPVVGVMSTGNEVASPGECLKPGQIYDSNRVALVAAVKVLGFGAVDMGIALDSRESLMQHLGKGFDEADVIVTTGGVSMGEKDLLKPVLEEEFGAVIHFGRVLMKPGKPATFATLERKGQKKLVFALPGNPVSAIVTLYLFVLPALRKMAGWPHPQPLRISAKLASAVSLDCRPEYYRVTLHWTEGDTLPTAVSTGSQCSSRLLSMRTANALLELPAWTEGVPRLEPGTIVKALLIGL